MGKMTVSNFANGLQMPTKTSLLSFVSDVEKIGSGHFRSMEFGPVV